MTQEAASTQPRDRSLPYKSVGLLVVLGVFAVSVYRAVHQSITVDEAYTYDLYVISPFKRLLIYYSANNHVLHTLLTRLSVEALGLSELTYRLPSLLGCLLYLVFVYKLCLHLFKAGWTFLLAMAALTLNPFIMDYLSVARGYGLALGLFTGALYLALCFFEDPWHAANYYRITGAAVLLGLSISANLVFSIPACALAGTLSLLLLFDKRRTAGWKQQLSWIADRVWLPMALPAVLLLAIPLIHAHKDVFYYGTTALRKTNWSLVIRSLFHQYDTETPASFPDARQISDLVTDWIVPLMSALMFATLAAICWRWIRARDFQRLGKLDRAYFLTGVVLAISLGILVAAHAVAGVPYPNDRTAIYLVNLFTLEWMVLLAKCVVLPRGSRTLGLLASAPAAIAIVLFLRGFTTSYYYEWRFDAGSKRIFHFLQAQALERNSPFNGGNPLKLGVNWKLNYTFNFYRVLYHADWLAKVNRYPAPESGNFDYYVLLPEDRETTKRLGLHVIYRDAVSHQEVAVPGDLPALSSQVPFLTQ